MRSSSRGSGLIASLPDVSLYFSFREMRLYTRMSQTGESKSRYFGFLMPLFALRQCFDMYYCTYIYLGRYSTCSFNLSCSISPSCSTHPTHPSHPLNPTHPLNPSPRTRPSPQSRPPRPSHLKKRIRKPLAPSVARPIFYSLQT